MKTFRTLITAMFLCNSFIGISQITINEYSASNLDDFADTYQKYEDWIELYNSGDEPVNLNGYYLSDKVDKPSKWQISEDILIQANGFVRFWCSGRDLIENEDYHTNFKLTQSKGNEHIVLSAPNGNIIESLTMELTQLGHSRCRELDGDENWIICTNPTLASSNNTANKIIRYTAEPTMDIEAGFYTDSITLTITNNEPNSFMRYTLDGVRPNLNSPIYTEPIVIDKTTIVNARIYSYDEAIAPGKFAYNTYFIDEEFTLPVISIGASQVIQLAGGQGELRPHGSVEYFDPSRGLYSRSYGEMNRHGQDSWALSQRSLDFICRDEMGYTKDIDVPLFTYSDRDEYQRLMLRASGDDNYPAINDFNHRGSCHVRDEYVHLLAREGDMKLDVRASERIIVFLNGRYWGVYGLREKPTDHDYTNEYYDQGKYDLEYLKTWGWSWAEYGGETAFEEWGIIRDFVLENDMSDPENYKYVKDIINLLSLIDFMIANLNSVASDWLNFNTAWWRGTNPEGDHKKWGYILWDCDATFDYYVNYSGVPNTGSDAVPCDIDEISVFMDDFFVNGFPNASEDIGKHEKIFLKLQEENPTFRQLYFSRQADLMNTVYSCGNMLSTLDSMVNTIHPEMPRQIERWGGSLEQWEENVAELRGFIEERCTFLDDGMVECFEVTEPYSITLLVEPVGIGEIDFNTLDIENFPWNGSYFGGMEHLISANIFNEFEDDYNFVRWESTSGNAIFPNQYDKNARIILTQPDTLIAHYGLETSVSQIDYLSELSVYPNPTSNDLSIRFELEQAATVYMSLHSITGQHIIDVNRSGTLQAAGQHIKSIHLTSHNINNGMYFLQINVDGQILSKKISIIN